jgi:predicted nucleic-acid-binding Zn-ribbon protein
MSSKGRLYCGKCHYTEFEGKKTEEKKWNNYL